MPVAFSTGQARRQAALSAPMFHQWTLPDGTPWTRFHRTDAGYLLRFVDLADFCVSSDGLRVECWPAPDVWDASIRHLYLNQVLPLALSRQGILVFHASAVEIDGKAIAFMGESGRGKSTLAASFATHGFRFLTDDGLVVEAVDDGWQVAPSHPSIRLWEDSEQALLDAGAQMAPPLPFTSKGRFLAGDRIAFCGQARPLHRVYFLGDGMQPEIAFEPLKPSEAMIELLRHSFLLDIEERQVLSAHFDELSDMVAAPLYHRLDYPRHFGNLAQVREAIVEHARTTGETA